MESDALELSAASMSFIRFLRRGGRWQNGPTQVKSRTQLVK